jgi:type IV secretory pathway VirB2 component (pilin)
MELSWGDLAKLIPLIPINIALVNWIKGLSNDKLGKWAMLVSVVLGFGVVFLATMPNPIIWYAFVRDSIILGLTSAGIFDIYAKQTK